MNQKEQIQQRIKEARRRWDTLSKRIEALKRDLSLELEGQKRVVYQEQLTDLETQRCQIETELYALEQASQGISVPLPHLRDRELAYLNDLLKDHEEWACHYVPLSGIAEVREAVKNGLRLDLPIPLIPREFAVLERHRFGALVETKRVPVDDVRTAVEEHRRIILLGDPGSGKTTTLRYLAHDYALVAREDDKAPLPMFVRLGGYSEDGSFEAYLSHHLGALASDLGLYL